ncbi:MAG: hypothetical protein WBH77_06870 [Saccharofermentanales bacterium]
MNNKIDKIVTNLEKKKIYAIAGERTHVFTAKTYDQLEEFIKAINLLEDKTTDNIKEVIAYCIDKVPLYIKKRTEKHLVTTYNKAKDIYDSSVVSDGHHGNHWAVTRAILTGYELGREYERKLIRTMQALSSTRLRRKPRIKGNRRKRKLKYNDCLPFNYQRIKAI